MNRPIACMKSAIESYGFDKFFAELDAVDGLLRLSGRKPSECKLDDEVLMYGAKDIARLGNTNQETVDKLTAVVVQPEDFVSAVAQRKAEIEARLADAEARDIKGVMVDLDLLDSDAHQSLFAKLDALDVIWIDNDAASSFDPDADHPILLHGSEGVAQLQAVERKHLPFEERAGTQLVSVEDFLIQVAANGNISKRETAEASLHENPIERIMRALGL